MAFVLCLGACLALLFASVQTSARQTPAPAAAASSDTRSTVQPVLDKYCVGCHSGAEAKGKNEKPKK